jgi:chromosome segregation ATPase
MKNRLILVILCLVCGGLVIALLVRESQSTKKQQVATETIVTLSNKWDETSAKLKEQQQVNLDFENDLKVQRESFSNLTNAYTDLSAKLDKTETTLKEEVARRDAKIADLESQNQALDQRAVDLSFAITNLTSQIEDTQKRLAASEGDKAFLEKELQRLMAEKAELERQFNDLAVLRAQVAKLKEELNVARRLEWIRQGLFARSEQKGAQQLMQPNTPAFAAATTSASKPAGNYDLNVEVSADGTVRVIPPATTNASTNLVTP